MGIEGNENFPAEIIDLLYNIADDCLSILRAKRPVNKILLHINDYKIMLHFVHPFFNLNMKTQ